MRILMMSIITLVALGWATTTMAGHHEEAEAPKETTPPVAAAPAPADTPVAAPAPADPAGGDEATPGEAEAAPEK